MLAEVARVLAPDGLLIISTPDRLAYSEATGQENPFHERELTEPELRALLGRHFGTLELFGQRAASGSRIEALDADRDTRHLGLQIERAGDEWQRGRSALAPLPDRGGVGASPLPELPSGSTLSDYGLALCVRLEAGARPDPARTARRSRGRREDGDSQN